jgi:hypothetical protein
VTELRSGVQSEDAAAADEPADPASDDRPDPPHLFVVHADLVRLACDDVLVPTNSDRTVTASLQALVPSRAIAEEPADGSPSRALRVSAPPGRVVELGTLADDRRAWLVDTAAKGSPDDDWIVESVEQWLAAVGKVQAAARGGRPRRLAALPLVGTGGGGASGRRGDLLRTLIPRLRAAAEDAGIDVALVLRSASDHAAAQRVRRTLELPWPLDPQLLAAADGLADRARANELALFLGAGVSAAAGLPLWSELLVQLATDAGLPEQDLAGLDALPPQDAASLLGRRMGGTTLRKRVGEIFADRPHALAHALLAALPVREVVTTNYDRLFEAAAEGTDRPVVVLPSSRPSGQERWLLKLHGDVGDADSVVLTREEFLEYDIGRSALSGVVQALLLTRHVLFVGLSLLDDNLVRIAHRAGQVRPAESGVVGTTLSLRRDPLRAELWSQALDDLAMSAGTSDTASAARRLEVFLDRLGAGAAAPVGYLLDPAYEGMLTDDERELAGRLRSVAEPLSTGGSTETPVGRQVQELLENLGLQH